MRMFTHWIDTPPCWIVRPVIVAQKVAWVRESVGEQFDALTLNILVTAVAITNNRRQAAGEMVRESGMPEIIEELQARREMYGFSHIVV